MSGLVGLEVSEGIATLTLDRAEAFNAGSVAMLQALHDAARGAVTHPQAHVILLRAAGPHFMVGGDLREFSQFLGVTPEGRLAAFRGLIEQWVNPTVLALKESRQPVVCAVRGACAGFGFSLMIGCDLAIAAEDAYFTTAYALLGTSPDGGGSYFLPRQVGLKRAAEMFLLPERFSADRARELGLVNRVVPVADLDDEALALARRLREGPLHAYTEVKRLLGSSLGATLDAQLLAEAEGFGRCSATQDFAEGIRAFLEKRKPGFSGR